MSREFPPSLRKQSPGTSPTIISDIMDEFRREPFSAFALQPFLPDRGYPALDVSESDSQIVVKAELPGIDPGDVELAIEDHILFIRGDKKFEAHDRTGRFHRIERSFGCFHRSVVLPCAVNSGAVRARLDKGILTITMDKSKKDSGGVFAMGS